MLKGFVLFIFCFSFTVMSYAAIQEDSDYFSQTTLADVCNRGFWITATSVDIKAFSKEDLEIDECHQFALTETPLSIALLYSQDSSVVGTYIEKMVWAFEPSRVTDQIDSNNEGLFASVVITEYNRAFTHFEWVEAEADNIHLYRRISPDSTLYKMHDAAVKRFRLWGLFMDFTEALRY